MGICFSNTTASEVQVPQSPTFIPLSKFTHRYVDNLSREEARILAPLCYKAFQAENVRFANDFYSVFCTWRWILVYDCDRIVAFASLSDWGFNRLFLANLVVDPAYRRCGIATELLQVVRRKRDLPNSRPAHPELLTFYQARGFTLVDYKHNGQHLLYQRA